MPKTMLTGTLEEQCAFLYNLAQEKMAAGNFTGAIHALKEILAHAPAFPGAEALMAQAKARKREQGLLLWGAFAGAIVAIFFGTVRQLPNDLWLLVLALGGAGVGFLVANAITMPGKRRRSEELPDAHKPATPDA